MTSKTVSDELWPLLPAPQVGARAGRPSLSNRVALAGIIFVLRYSMAHVAAGNGVVRV
ncbi:hypothetical protein ACT3SA_07355 [Halomonas sp. AOP42-A1-22]|uniref:hypothetical protein n=1 Tax=unclassified Halomonas TaxID=2609666 RepID=UPI004033DA5A